MSQTAKPRRKTIRLPRLDSECISVVPQDYDFSEGYPEKWEVAFDTSKEPCESCDASGKVKCTHEGCVEGKVRCPNCNGTCEIDNEDYDPNDADCVEDPKIDCDECDGEGTVDCDECDGEGTVDCEDCDGDGMRDCDGDGWFPMMNYFYPLPSDFDIPDDVQSKLNCCTIVRFEDGTLALALTGGGMNLSWEICSTYINLGLLPPAHFAHLPRMSGRGEKESDLTIMAYCRESLRILADQAKYSLEGFERDFPNAPRIKRD